jgi:hypothetical protein
MGPRSQKEVGSEPTTKECGGKRMGSGARLLGPYVDKLIAVL